MNPILNQISASMQVCMYACCLVCFAAFFFFLETQFILVFFLILRLEETKTVLSLEIKSSRFYETPYWARLGWHSNNHNGVLRFVKLSKPNVTQLNSKQLKSNFVEVRHSSHLEHI